MPKVSRDRIVELARECIGTPFHMGGRNRGGALDCVGVLMHVAAGLGIELHPPRRYTLSVGREWIEEKALGALTRVATPRIGSILFMFGRLHKTEIKHFGILTSVGQTLSLDATMVHCVSTHVRETHVGKAYGGLVRSVFDFR